MKAYLTCQCVLRNAKAFRQRSQHALGLAIRLSRHKDGYLLVTAFLSSRFLLCPSEEHFLVPLILRWTFYQAFHEPTRSLFCALKKTFGARSEPTLSKPRTSPTGASSVESLHLPFSIIRSSDCFSITEALQLCAPLGSMLFITTSFLSLMARLSLLRTRLFTSALISPSPQPLNNTESFSCRASYPVIAHKFILLTDSQIPNRL